MKNILKINLDSIGEDSQVISQEISGLNLDLDESVSEKGPISLKYMIYRLGEKIYIQGRAKIDVELTCARCLMEFATPLQAELLLVAVPVEQYSPDQESREQDPVFVAYRGGQLDLFREIRSALLLAIPMKPLCREDCPGLCCQCGKRLAEGACSCSRKRGTGTLAALENLSKTKKVYDSVEAYTDVKQEE
ncbi:DUF177 domain-containing protein [bacterium]|nr:DUF177 domain-containing protein [bacterium]